MKTLIKNRKKLYIAFVAVAAVMIAVAARNVKADENATARENIYIENYNVGGMTADEMNQVMENKLQEYAAGVITVNVGSQSMSFTAADFGIYQTNTEIVEQILKIGKGGNVWKRFQAKEYYEESNNSVFGMKFGFSDDSIRSVVENQLTQLNIARTDVSLVEDESGNISATQKQDGISVDTEATIQAITNYLNNDWHGGKGTVNAVTVTDAAEGDYDTYSLVKDVLGQGITTFETTAAYANRVQNITNAVSKINGTILQPGEEFSTEQCIEPFTAETGYATANSYEMGAVVQTYGGGVCQVSTTLYSAVLNAELEVTERCQHSMEVDYVKPALDAAIAENVKDFKFVNNTDTPIYIQGYVSGDTVVFNIIGHETRDASRTVEYESEILSQEDYTTNIIFDSSSAFGNIGDTSGHRGIKAVSYKIVKVNGEQISKDKLNTSEYKRSDRTVTVGTKGAPADALSELNTAYSSKNG